MSCASGQPWYALRTEACYFDADSGVFHECRCPITTCAVSVSTGHAACQYTGLVLGLMMLLFAAFWALVFASMSAGNRAKALGQLRGSKQAVEAWAYRTLFPSNPEARKDSA